MILMKDIIREGHPTLAKRSEEVPVPLTDEDKQILVDMMEYMTNSQDPILGEEYGLRAGVGLSAPQINISKRLIVVYTTDEKGEKLYNLMLANPKIVSHSEAMTYIPGGEGCLSVDREVTGLVPRYKKIRVRAHQYIPETDETKTIELRVGGYVGVVIQHEIDHLNGVLFVDKLEQNLDHLEPIVFPEEEHTEEEM